MGIYYGWKNLLGSFLGAAIAIGFTSYVFGVFTVPVTQELGISHADFNNLIITFMIGMALMSPVAGSLLDRYSARTLFLVGGVLFGGCLILISRLQSAYVILALVGLPLTFATGTCGMISANTVTVRWFSRRRGRALGVLALSTSVGGFVTQPLTALLIESLGWRDALFLIGIGSLILLVLAGIFVIRDRPTGGENGYGREFGTTDEMQSAGDSGHITPERLWQKKELLRSRNFWILSVCIGVMFGIDQAVLVSQVPYFHDIGFDLTTAALLVSVKTISAIVGKLLIGYFADKIDLRLLFVAVAVCNATLMAIYVSEPTFWILLIAVAFLGIAVGGIMPVWTTLMAWLFGSRSYGTVMGFMSIIMQPFAVITLRFVGVVRDTTGSYTPAFSVFIGAAIIASALVWLLRPEKAPNVPAQT